MSLIRKTKLAHLSRWNSRLLHKEWHHWLGDTVQWWKKPRASQGVKLFPLQKVGCQLSSRKQFVALFPAEYFPVLSSVGVQCKTIMGKADIKQGLDLVVVKQPVPLLQSEIQEWQESPVIDGLFTSVSECPLMSPGMCKTSDIYSHQVATVEYCL